MVINLARTVCRVLSNQERDACRHRAQGLFDSGGVVPVGDVVHGAPPTRDELAQFLAVVGFDFLPWQLDALTAWLSAYSRRS